MAAFVGFTKSVVKGGRKGSDSTVYCEVRVLRKKDLILLGVLGKAIEEMTCALDLKG